MAPNMNPTTPDYVPGLSAPMMIDVATNTSSTPVQTRRSNAFMHDELRTNTISNLLDGINAAWNGWELACKYEDEAMQIYYMKYVSSLNGVLEKVRKF